MSRTYKDKPDRLKRYPRLQDVALYKTEEVCQEYTYEFVDGELKKVRLDEPRTFTRKYYLQQKTTKPKKRKRQDTEWHWMSTPSWWTRMTMNRPQRRQGRLWERKVLFEDVEETDPPLFGKKPHNYYW